MHTLADLSLKHQIIVHLNYRDIFNFPIRKNELVLWLNREEDQELNQAIWELEKESLISFDGDYLCIKGKEWTIEERKNKIGLTAKIIHSGKGLLGIFKRIPFLFYIGVSGSVAAENPTIDREGVKAGTVDLDLFVITKSNALWVSYFIVKSLNGLIRKFRLSKHYLCFNYAMDEAYLEIHNKNFFTATELYNLKSLVNEAKPRLINNNLWVKNYYPGITVSPTISKITKPIFIVRWLNYSLFSLFQFLRIFKRKNLHPIREINSDFNIGQRHNLRRVCPPNGGYQHLILWQFDDRFKNHFPEYYDEKVVGFLFPSMSLQESKTKSEIHYDQEMFDNFKRYAQP